MITPDQSGKPATGRVRLGKMKHLEETMYPPNLKKYKNIDKDILQLETIKKNLIMKGRRPNAEGGLAHVLGV